MWKTFEEMHHHWEFSVHLTLFIGMNDGIGSGWKQLLGKLCVFVLVSE